MCVGGMDRFVCGMDRFVGGMDRFGGCVCLQAWLLVVVVSFPGLFGNSEPSNGVARGFPGLNPSQADMQNKTAMVRMRLGGIPQGVRGAYTPQTYTSQA